MKFKKQTHGPESTDAEQAEQLAAYDPLSEEQWANCSQFERAGLTLREVNEIRAMRRAELEK